MSFNLLVGGTIQAVASTGAVVTMGIFGDEIATSPTNSFKKLDQRVLPAGPTLLYTVTGPVTMTIIKTITLWNSSGAAVTVDIFTDGTAAANHTTSVKVPANGTAIWENNGWVVQDANSAIITTAVPITATGDATGVQSGSTLPLTLATFGPGTGTVGSATQVSQITPDTKGRIATLAAVSIQIAESQVTNLVTDLAGKISAISNDATTPGGGSGVLTLATVNPNVGSFGSATQVMTQTVNAKGITTAAGNVSIQIAESQVTNLVADLAAKVTNSRTLFTTLPLTGGGDLSADRTLAINNATVLAAGAMSAPDKKKEDNIWVDMTTQYAFVGDDATLNDAAWTAFLASPPPQGSVLFFPAGIYRFANEVTLNQDKRWKFKGAGAQVTFFKTTSITANIFNFTVAGFYTTWEDMGFLTTVVKTAGAAIAITAGNNSGCDIRRVSFNGMFIGVDLQGAQSGNVSVFDSWNYGAPPANGRMLRVNGSTINIVITNSTSNCVPNAGAIAGTTNVEVNQSGAVQIIGCDLIGGINSILLNANQGGGSSIAAIYVTNTFLDQSGGSTLKITGANTTNRVKFTECGIAAGVIGGNAVEIAGTGAGAVGTATAMPAGISFVDCDVYYAPGASTASGFLVNGCQDISIQNTRVAGFSGVGGAGIHVIGSASNQTRVRINGCRIGPNSNLTINNTVGVQLDAGSSGLGALSITDNDIGGNTTAFVDNSPAVAGVTKYINNNFGIPDGAGTSAPSASFSTTPTQVLPVFIPVGVTPGSSYKFEIHAQIINTTTASNIFAQVAIGGTNVGVSAGMVVGTTAHASPGLQYLITGMITFITTTTAESVVAIVPSFQSVTAGAGNLGLNSGGTQTAPIAVGANTALQCLLSASGATTTIVVRQAVVYKVS